MIIALLLATAQPFCARAEQDFPLCRRFVTETARICGPDGANDWDDRYGPSCERYGWNGRRYVDFCEGSKAHPGRHDPWLAVYLHAGEAVKDAQIELSDDRINSCDGS